MAKERIPELVVQRAYGPGQPQQHTFEDALRDLVRNSPYLGISLLLHGLIFAIFAMVKIDTVLEVQDQVLMAQPETPQEVILPEPPPEPPEPEPIDQIIEQPTISENPSEISDEHFDSFMDSSSSALGAFDSVGTNDVIGVGGGAAGGFGGKLGRRGGGGGGTIVGKAELEAVDNALAWLKAHQDPEGYWSAASFDDQCGQLGDGYCTGRGNPQHDVGITGLALLAFLGAGHSDKEGRYQDTVNAGLRFLIRNQGRSGNFAEGNASNFMHTYDHIIATLAMVEAYALSGKRPPYRRSVVNALRYMYSLRTPGAAWRYADRNHDEMLEHQSDTSVTGWAIIVLTLARDYGIEIDENALEDSMLFIEEMTDSSTGRTGYHMRGSVSSRLRGTERDWPYDATEAMTAVGMLCRIFVDPNMTRPNNRQMIEKGAKLLLALPIKWPKSSEPGDLDPRERGRVDFYYWYYASYALYQWGSEDSRAWKEWEKGILDIVHNQVQTGDQKGSWDPNFSPWSNYGGRVYSTAILTLLLEVYYRYDSVMGGK